MSTKSATAASGVQRRPIFDRTKVQPRSVNKALSQVSPAKREQTPETLQSRLVKKSFDRICCLNCRLNVGLPAWNEHLNEPCYSWTLTTLEVRAAKELLKIKPPENRAEKKNPRGRTSHGSSEQEETDLRRTPCVRCGKVLSAMAMEIHMEHCHQGTKSTDFSFPFELLPQSISDDFRTYVRKYLFKDHPSSLKLAPYDWDWSRLDDLNRLKPRMTYFGTKGWFGYCVFEFSQTSKVVLETALRGNATYVVGANWKELISMTKPELRKGDHERIFHLGNYWRRRVQKALWKDRIPFDVR